MSFRGPFEVSGKFPVPLEDAIANMAVIEAIFKAAESASGRDRKGLNTECTEARSAEGTEKKGIVAVRTILQLGDPGLRRSRRELPIPPRAKSVC